MKFPRFSFPVLTRAEKTAVIVLTIVFSSGAALRAWEHSGMQLGPVKDWESLRKLVVQARQAAGSDTVYPCFDPPPINSEEHWPHRTQDSAEGSATSSPNSRSSSKKTPPTEPLDLNLANVAALQKIPGIGPSTAKAIVSRRVTLGKFRKVEDLLDVKGIGSRKFATMRRFLRL